MMTVMYRKKHEFKWYAPWEALLVTSLSAILFLTSCIFVGYGIYSTEFGLFPVLSLTQVGPFPDFIVPEILSELLQIHYRGAIILTWLIGVFGIVASLLGFASVLRWTIFSLLKRKR